MRLRARSVAILSSISVTLLMHSGSAGPAWGGFPQPVGLWSFDGDLEATIGKGIEPAGELDMQFGVCSDWDLPLIGGGDESIVRLGRRELPNSDAYLKVTPGLSPSGGGKNCNEYTLVMDILFQEPFGDGGWTSILNLDGSNQEIRSLLYAAPRGRAGVSRLNSGYKSTPDEESVSANEWHRIVYRVRTEGDRLAEDFFINGEHKTIASRNLSLIDGRNSAPSLESDPPWMALWGQPYRESNTQGTAYINSLAFYDLALSDSQVHGLGGVSPGGIPDVIEWSGRVGVAFRDPIEPVFVPVRDEAAIPIPGAGAPYYATHDFSEAIIADGDDVYLAWFGNGSYIARRDGLTGLWSEPFLLGGVSADQYRYPDMVMDQEGYIHVFFGGHGWFSRDGDPFTYRRTVRPRDISEWTDARTIGWQCAFPRPVILKDGRILLFHRGSNRVGDTFADHGWGYIESRDNGSSWSPFVRLVAENYVLYGGGEIVERPGQPATIHWGWCWWDEGVCDLGTYYSPNPMVPCKYDDVVYAEFVLDAGGYADAAGQSRLNPVRQADIPPLWKREFLSVADLAVDPEGRPVLLFSDYEDRLDPRMLIATRLTESEWIVEEPLAGLPVSTNNMRLRRAGEWMVIVCWVLGHDPGIVVAQRKGGEGPFIARQIRHQDFPFTMHPMFREDIDNGRLHVTWAEGDRISPSRLMYMAVPLEP